VSESAPLLQVRGLTRRFGGLLAVSDLDLAVYPGEILGLIGPNGAGKSTTFAMIAGAIPPSSGEIIFKGLSLVGQPTHAFAANGIVRTFQHNKPFDSMGIEENVMVGMHTQIKHSLWQVVMGTAQARASERAAREKARRGRRRAGCHPARARPRRPRRSARRPTHPAGGRARRAPRTRAR